ncbi:hypothetical protein [Teredinibacter haidensis]|uniref:hypothetical protein n=1 Tax=Teredinibacter haidensis TaxID=2731755 RepID=UPI000948EA49|nr:hypothetical protein [Teredinibacter haidensis]
MIELISRFGNKLLFTPKRLAISTLLAASLLQGCTFSQQKADNVVEETPSKPKAPTKIADRSFSTDTLYALLVAEMAIDRKRYDIALNNYVQQSLSTRDLEVTARATQIARILKAHQPALEMAELWVELEPDSEDALLIANAELIEANRLEEAVELSTRILKNGGATAFDAIAVRATEGDIETVRKLSHNYAKLLQQYPEEQQLLLGNSVLLQQDGRFHEALTSITQVLRQDPNHLRAAFQETRILQQMGKQDLALKKLAALVENNPDNVTLRARYARIVAATDLNESRKQFEALHKQAPSDPEIQFSLAIVEKESGHLSSAEQHFKALILSGYYLSPAHYHLGDIYENRNQEELALGHYQSVGAGPHYLGAMARATGILSNSDREIDALNMIRDQRKQAEGSDREGLFILESEVMSTAGQMSAAETVLSNGLSEFPESTRLLYSRAMLYTRIDYIAAAEQDLKLVISLTPTNAAALNALGYTLADRTERVEEAYSYIMKAYALTPEDPAVIDSLGWVEYRRGNFQAALVRLRQAMKVMPDHEIAAHLGEVLWVTGGEAEAVKVWKQGLHLNPQSSVIRDTLHRLKVDLD